MNIQLQQKKESSEQLDTFQPVSNRDIYQQQFEYITCKQMDDILDSLKRIEKLLQQKYEG